jgi:hypothetical protein
MSLKPLLALCAAAGLLTACETYTEKTSPCFGKTGTPQVTRSPVSVSTMGTLEDVPAKSDCSFEPLPRPE